MSSNPRLQELLDELFDSSRTPEEVCVNDPELLTEVREQWRRMTRLQADLDVMFPPEADEPPLDPTALPRIAGYEVETVLGRGGMGIIYRARQVRLNRLVAVKMVLTGAFAGPGERQRFQREAEAVAALGHPNIVPIYDIGEAEGRPYFTMEYLAGGSLGQKLAGTPQPARAAAALAARLADAVQAAHARGIVHRDLKPANVLLTSDGTPKITDFGLARRLDGESALTRTGFAQGTPSYMAPEQARGQTEAGPAVDVYALGAILYELLTGRPPFRAETAEETFLQVVSQDPVAPSRLNARVPRDLDTICMKCLEKDPRRRYARAADLAADLKRYLRHKPILARPLGKLARLRRWIRRHVGLSLALAGIALLLVLLIIGSLWSAAYFRELEAEQRGLAQLKSQLADENEHERAKAVQAEKRETALRGQAEEQARELRQNLYFARMNLAGQAALSPSGIGRVSQWLAEWEKAPPDLRNWEWYYLNGLCHRDLRTLRGHLEGVMAVAWSLDSRLASAGADGTVRLWDHVGGREIRMFRGHQAAVAGLAWSPDSRKLASASWDGTVRIWDVSSGKELLVFRGHTGKVYSVAWNPDGRRLASGGSDRTVRVWDAAGGVGMHVFRGHEGNVAAVAWSPDGKRLASAGWDFALHLWDAQTGKEGRLLGRHANWINGIAWSPDGARLASASNDQTVKVWDVAGGKELLTLREHAQGVQAVAWSPDGQRLATGSDDQTVKLWPLAGGEARTLRGHTAAVTSVAWSPDGTRLASASSDATAKIWDQATGPETPALPGLVKALAWHPDGQRLAAGKDGAVKIWDMTQRRELATLTGHPRWLHCTAWSRQGVLATAGVDVIRLWDAASGKVLKALSGHTGEVYSVAWSPDGRRLASGGLDQTVRIWDVATGQPLKVCKGHEGRVSSVAWSPDGAQLASASGDRTIRVWQPETGRPIRVIPVHGGEVNWVAWSPDGRRLASAGYDQMVKITDPAMGRVTLTLAGHTARVNVVVWSPDGTRLASAGEDSTVRIWDAGAGKEILTLNHPSHVNSLAWSPDGFELVTAGNDGTGLVYDARSGYWAARSPRYLPVLERRLAADPNNWADWQLRAEIHAQQQDWDAAAADLRHLLLQPGLRWYAVACWVVGPYPEDLRTSHSPERNAHAGAFVVTEETGPAGPLVWQRIPEPARGFVDFGALLGHAEHISAYAQMRIYSSRREQLALLCGSDDQVRLWLNGKQIHEHLQPRRAVPDEDAILATLEPGWNTLLARVANVTGDHALCWRLSDAPADLERARSQSRR